jgi:segregation and condensation protein B
MEGNQKIEAILFMRGEPVKIKELSKILSLTIEETEDSIEILETDLTNRGVRLMRKDDSVVLTTAPEISSILQSIAQEELKTEIGKAGMEVLTIILYTSPVSRRHIDYIRGVNSSSTIRTLVLKGLVERHKTKVGLGFTYSPTVELLAFLGLTKNEDLHNYQTLRDKFLGILNSESDTN